ncbi:hypothetical protein TNCV_1876901 [Trichonephila clavipes]|nr:hypothetical protein TNCV_1876901 [Trichonephila clavipes]
MQIKYGAMDYNGYAAQWLYQISYPNRHVPRHMTFTSCGSPVNWPLISLDLSCMDFFFWVHMKNLVYEMPTPSVEDLAQISVAAGKRHDMPRIFQNLRNSTKCHSLSDLPGDIW